MAGKNRRSPLDLKLDLLKEGHAFSFYQVIRLLRLLEDHPNRFHTSEPDFEDVIRIKPEMSLAFPASDVAKITETSDEKASFEVTATFLALYGVSSPLPTFYTEDIIDEASQDESVTRDFLDFINHSIFSLLFDCWTKYRQYLQVVENKNDLYLERLFSLLGLGEPELRNNLPNAYPLIRYIGLLTQFPRSALGLKTLLRDALAGIPLEVIACFPRNAKIPQDQVMLVGNQGNSLGVNTYLGEVIADRMGKFRIQLGPLTRRQFRHFTPGRKGLQWLSLLTDFYIIERLEYDVELIMAPGEALSVRLGDPDRASLGVDSWIFSADKWGEVRAIFQSSRAEAKQS